MNTFLNQFIKLTPFLCLFLCLPFPNFISAMQRIEVKSDRPSSASSTGNWFRSMVSLLYNEKPRLGFYKQPKPDEKMEKAHLELLEKALRGEIPLTVSTIEGRSLVDCILTWVNAQTLAYFIEHGAQPEGTAIIFLSMASKDDPHAQRVEKLKVLIKAGYDVNYRLSSFTPLGTVFSSSNYNFSAYDQMTPNHLPCTSFEYDSSCAKVLLNGDADPNLRSLDGKTCFNILLDAIVQLGQQTHDDPDLLLTVNRHIQAFKDQPYPLETEQLIVKAFLACGADFRNVAQKTWVLLEARKSYIIHLITSFETDKAALFSAIDEQDFEKIKALAQRLPFKIKNAIGDFPLHHAVRNLKGTSDFTLTTLDNAAQNSKNIIILLLRVLPQLAALKNSRDETPINMIFLPSKFWMLKHCFVPACLPPPSIINQSLCKFFEFFS